MNFSIDQNEAIAHLSALGFRAGDQVCLRFFYPAGDARKASDKGAKLTATFPNLPWKRIDQLQAEGRGLYFVVNGGGHRDNEISSYRAVFFEHDHLAKELSRDLWQHLGFLKPTFQVDTGGKSIHSYFKLTESSDCSASQWRELQADLLEYLDADRSLKNPSRVMRLAGGFHLQPGREPVQTRIISQSGKSYSYEEVRLAVPQRQGRPKIKWLEFDRTFSFPIPEAVPLEACLSWANRDFLEQGAAEGQRNDRGFALASDLVGAAGHLASVGQRFEGDPESLFQQYGRRCSPALESGELAVIWNSAKRRGTSPALPKDAIVNCVKGWKWRQLGENSTTPITQTAGDRPPGLTQPKPSESLSPEQVAAEVKRLLAQDLAATELATERVSLRARSTISERDFDRLWAAVEREADLQESEPERRAEVEHLLKLGSSQLNLNQILDPPIAQPMQEFAHLVGATSTAMLLSLLATIASLCRIETRLLLAEATDFYALPILYICVVAESGSGKSPAQKEIIKPLMQLQEEAEERYREDLRNWQLECAEAKENEAEQPDKPTLREYFTVDVTREAIALIQAGQQDYGFLGYQDELSALINSQNAYRGGKGADKEALLSGRDGSPVKVNRASGKRIYAKQSAYSILGGTQPGTLRRMMRSSGEEFADPSGQWARFLWEVMPNNPASYPEGEPLHLASLLRPIYCRVSCFPPQTYRFSQQAQEIYKARFNSLVEDLRQESNPAIRAVLSKMRGTTGEIALLLHLTNAAIAATQRPHLNLTPTEEIGSNTLNAAIALSKHCINQVRLIQAWGGEATGDISPTITKLVALLEQKGKLAARDVQAALRSKKLSAIQARELLRQTAALGYGHLEGSGSRLMLVKAATADPCCKSDQHSEIAEVSASCPIAAPADPNSSKLQQSESASQTSFELVPVDQQFQPEQAVPPEQKGFEGAADLISSVQHDKQLSRANFPTEQEFHAHTQDRSPVAAGDQQFAIRQLCRYVGQEFRQLKGLGQVVIQSLSGDQATIRHQNWLVSHTVPLADLRRIEP